LLRFGEGRWIVRLELGSPVNCTDGPFGELADVVIDPTKRRVTHLVVGPHREHDKARLVPVELASNEEDGSSAISLGCSLEEAGKLELVEEYAYLRLGESPDLEPGWDVGVESVLAQPYYGYGTGFGYEPGPGEYDPNVSVTYDRIPKGEVEVRRASEVTSADGHHLGKVDGFLVDDTDAITHFVLERGHLWGKKEVTVPINAVASVHTDAVSLSLTKDEVGELPSVPVHRWGR
jgi:sporulation protein YlmC with PRC-barrel domain